MLFTITGIVVLLIVLGMAVASYWQSTHGSEMRVSFRSGRKITVITVRHVPPDLFETVARACGLTEDEISQEDYWLDRVIRLIKPLVLKRRAEKQTDSLY